MCQMCEEYEAELRRHGIEPDLTVRDKRHPPQPETPRAPEPTRLPELVSADHRS